MKLESVPLFVSFKEAALFCGLLVALFLFSAGWEYKNYKLLSRFDEVVVQATVTKQYLKENEKKVYNVLKLRMDQGATFYMTGSAALRKLTGYPVRARIRTAKVTFPQYLFGFFAPGYVEAMAPCRQPKYRLADVIMNQHTDPKIGGLFAALFTATPIDVDVRDRLSALGISHLLAISGFHIGLLSVLLYGVLKLPYGWFQSRFFPWRNGRRDLSVLAAFLMLGYVLFLEMTPSVMRAYAMMLVGFILYDRGIKVVSIQTLFIASAILIALWPRLMGSIGFWLSVAGVLYILLFLRQYGHLGKKVVWTGIHVWVYLMMLPLSLALFGTFSAAHPLSILLTMLFVLFYPMALLLHLLGWGSWLDGVMQALLEYPLETLHVAPVKWAVILWIVLTLAALKSELVKWLMFGIASAVLVGAVYQVAQL